MESERGMVERVALQIALDVYGGYPVDKTMREAWATWSICQKSASVAIKAMREPTQTMVAVVAGKCLPDGDPIVVVYQAMIDAALDPHP